MIPAAHTDALNSFFIATSMTRCTFSYNRSDTVAPIALKYSLSAGTYSSCRPVGDVECSKNTLAVGSTPPSCISNSMYSL